MDMATAEFTYVVGLATDDGGPVRKPTYQASLDMLKEFLKAHNGEYLGPFTQDFKDHPEYAVVKMSKTAEDALQQENIDLLTSKLGKPFIARLEGCFFDINRETKGQPALIIHKDPFFTKGIPECTT